jgi:hypothetical protein
MGLVAELHLKPRSLVFENEKTGDEGRKGVRKKVWLKK